MVSVAQVQQGVRAFVEHELLPKIPGWQGVVFGAAVGMALSKSDKLIVNLAQNPIVAMLGVIDANDGSDIDALRDEFAAQARRVGSIKIDMSPLGVISLGESDINRLYQYIKEV